MPAIRRCKLSFHLFPYFRCPRTALKTRACGRGDVCTQKTQPSKKCWGQRWELNLSSSSGSSWKHPLSSGFHPQHMALSAEHAQLTPHSETEQTFFVMTHSCHHGGFTHSRSRQTTHPGWGRPCFTSSHRRRRRELSHPPPASPSQQPDGEAGRRESEGTHLPRVKHILLHRNVLEDLWAKGNVPGHWLGKGSSRLLTLLTGPHPVPLP